MQSLIDMLPEPTTLDRIKDLESAEETGFYLYREAVQLVCISASIYFGNREEFPLERDQAILNGMMMRICKYMKAVLKLASERSDGDVINALNRCILESTVNMEYLLVRGETKAFDEFVERSLGPEKELYEEVQKNILARGGEVQPIEKRILSSINDVVSPSGKTIDEIAARPGSWGGNFRQRLELIGKGDLYLYVQQVGSHPIHGTWVNIFKGHLVQSADKQRYRVKPLNSPDARLLTPHAYLVLDAVKIFLTKVYTDHLQEVEPLSDAVESLLQRLLKFEEVHEQYFCAER